MIYFLEQLIGYSQVLHKYRKCPFKGQLFPRPAAHQTVAETVAWLARTSNPTDLFYVPNFNSSNNVYQITTLQFMKD
jgi:hypothetical protein